MNNKELLVSVTAADCDFIFQRGRGKGGQNRNKRDTACICKHKLSGAEGYAEDERSQKQNKELAFKRMAESAKFQSWLKMEISRKTGQEKRLEEEVNYLMSDRFLKVESKDENGRWVDYVEKEE